MARFPSKIPATIYVRNIATALTAAGTTQATALLLGAELNALGTVASSSGVRLPVGVPGMRMIVFNGGANTLKVYPASGGTLNGAAADAEISIATLVNLVCYCYLSNKWACTIS